MSLTVLTITRGEPIAVPNIEQIAQLCQDLGAEFVIGVDGDIALKNVEHLGAFASIHVVQTNGVYESVIDEMVSKCSSDYILRLDGDERVPPLMKRWLLQRRYLRADQWKFPRAWLWTEESEQEGPTFLDRVHYWPDYQVRLSTKKKSGGIRTLHAIPQHGPVAEAPVAIEHLKLMMFSLAEREEHMRGFDRAQQGAGSNFRHFYAPETLGTVIGVPWDSGLRWRVECAFADASAYPMSQYPEELKDCVRWLLRQDLLGRVLEIGTQSGGTAAVWCELADSVISVDLPGGPFGSLDMKNAKLRNKKLADQYASKAGVLFTGILGDSHDAKVCATVRKVLNGDLLDLVFVDGDHSLSGVTADFNDYVRLVRPGGVMLFHDIVETDFVKQHGVEVYKFWRDLCAKFPDRTCEFSINGDFGGIGVYTV